MSHLTRLTSLSLEVGKSVNPSWILVGSSHVVHSMSNVVRNWMDDISRCWLMRSDLTRWEIHVQSWRQVDKASDMHQIRSLKVPRGANVIVQGRLVEDTTPGLFVLEALTHWSCVCVCVFPSFSSKIHKVAMLDWKALESSKCSDAVFVFICPAHRVVRGGWQIGSLEDRQVLARQGVQLHHATANGTFYVFVLDSGNSAGTESADISEVCDPVVWSWEPSRPQ